MLDLQYPKGTRYLLIAPMDGLLDFLVNSGYTPVSSGLPIKYHVIEIALGKPQKRMRYASDEPKHNHEYIITDQVELLMSPYRRYYKALKKL